MPDVIKFPLPKKPLRRKHKSTAMTPAHIIYTIESVLSDGLSLQHVPVILSYTYTGILSIKETEDSVVLKVKNGSYSCAYLIKKSSFIGITKL
jgi:hypothetical protein